MSSEWLKTKHDLNAFSLGDVCSDIYWCERAWYPVTERLATSYRLRSWCSEYVQVSRDRQWRHSAGPRAHCSDPQILGRRRGWYRPGVEHTNISIADYIFRFIVSKVNGRLIIHNHKFVTNVTIVWLTDEWHASGSHLNILRFSTCL